VPQSDAHLVGAQAVTEGEYIGRATRGMLEAGAVLLVRVRDDDRELIDHLLPERREIVALVAVNPHRDPATVMRNVNAGGGEAGLADSALAEDDGMLPDSPNGLLD